MLATNKYFCVTFSIFIIMYQKKKKSYTGTEMY